MKIINRRLRAWISDPPRLFALLIPLAIACFALSPNTKAACQDACLTNSNTVEGDDALISLTSGHDDTALGFQALLNDTTGEWNTAMGSLALNLNTTGLDNTATGYKALYSNTTGSWNTAFGSEALDNNTTGEQNTALGHNAMSYNTSGGFNSAVGMEALKFNTTGGNNVAIGYWAMYYNTIGGGNVAIGGVALGSNSSGNNNTAIGNAALVHNWTGNNNTAISYQALADNVSGNYNTAIGYQALSTNTNGERNTASGANALYHNKTGNNNIALGNAAGFNLTTGGFNIDIGNIGVAGEAHTMRVGTQGTQTATYIAGISGATVPTGIPVVVDSDGHLGTTTSSVRFKEAIKPMDKASEAILSLEPVTFRYKKDLDPKAIPQFGLIAEQVEEVDPDLVARDEKGKAYTVRYDAVNAMLLNEFLKEHRKLQELQKALIEQGRIFESKLADQQGQIQALTAGLQKVSGHLQEIKSAPEVVLNAQ